MKIFGMKIITTDAAPPGKLVIVSKKGKLLARAINIKPEKGVQCRSVVENSGSPYYLREAELRKTTPPEQKSRMEKPKWDSPTE